MAWALSHESLLSTGTAAKPAVLGLAISTVSSGQSALWMHAWLRPHVHVALEHLAGSSEHTGPDFDLSSCYKIAEQVCNL